MQSDREINYDRSLLGVEHPVGEFPITREAVLRFARATGEPGFGKDEAASSTTAAPPTFCNVFLADVTRPDIKLDFGDTGFFAGQAIECLGAVRPGDTLTATTKLLDVYSKTGRSGKMVFIAWETSFSNQRNEVVALVRDTHVRRNRRA